MLWEETTELKVMMYRGPSGFKDMLTAAKASVDPRSIMNPGVLIDSGKGKIGHWMEN